MNPPPDPSHFRVLVADDEKPVSYSISYILKRLGCEVDVVDDGAPALEKIRQEPDRYHLLVTDHAMLTMDGLALVTELRRMEFAGKIMVVSGYLTASLDAAYRALGVDRIFFKPFEITTLRNAAVELLEQQLHATSTP